MWALVVRDVRAAVKKRHSALFCNCSKQYAVLQSFVADALVGISHVARAMCPDQHVLCTLSLPLRVLAQIWLPSRSFAGHAPQTLLHPHILQCTSSTTEKIEPRFGVGCG